MIAPMRRPVVVFAGGGTGGHLFPGVAVARALDGLDVRFLVPHDRGDVARIAGEFRSVTMIAPRPAAGRLLYPVRLARAVAHARRLLREFGAQAVVGLGGYGAVPACLAARSLGLPLYLMELNAVPGKATRWLARFARGVGLGAPAARARLPLPAAGRVTGTPLRAELRATAVPRDFDLEDGLPTLAIIGGSQGAEGLNRRLLAALPSCADLSFQVLHCAGAKDLGRVRDAYARLPLKAHVLGFVPDIGRVYSVADLVLARAGASTVAECAARGLPAVFVPYPWHRDRQQTHNAQEAVDAGAARLIEETHVDEATLRTIVADVLCRPATLARMSERARRIARPNAARAMAAHLLESVGETWAKPHGTVELGE